MMNAVLKHWHPMVGIDFHTCVTPPAGVPTLPMTPYKTGMVLWGATFGMVTQSYFRDHPSSGWGTTMSRGTDIGPLIPHIGPPSLTLPIEIIFSSSKSHFGVASYSGVDNKGAQNCIAVALIVHVNLNLNCGIAWPTPTGMVIALNTHYVGMTLGDFIVGVLSMAVDAVLQRAMSALGSALGRLPGYLGQRMIPSVFRSNGAAFNALWAANRGAAGMSRAARREAARAAAKALRENQIIQKALFDCGWGGTLSRGLERLGARASTPVGEAVIGFFLGSPTGADASNVPGGASAFSAANDYLTGSEELTPSPPPPIN